MPNTYCSLVKNERGHLWVCERQEYGSRNGESGYWLDFGSRGFTDTDGASGVASRASLFLATNIKYNQSGKSFSFAAWERSINAKFTPAVPRKK